MKILSTLLLASMTSLTVNAQQLINQKDPFSGKQLKGAVVTFGNMFKNIGQGLGFGESDGKEIVSLTWMPSASGTNVDGINFDNFNLKNCSILVLMDDDSIIKFKADSTLSKKTGTGQTAMLAILASITEDQLRFLSLHDVKTIRLGLTEQNAGVDVPFVNDKTRKQIKKAALFMISK
jgi:hypothetical protein